MQIVLLGTGGPLPDPQRGGSAILIHAAGRYHLFDCGVGATRQMVRAQVDPATVNHVFFSHLHYDHTADFPYFICPVAGVRTRPFPARPDDSHDPPRSRT